MTDSVFTSNVPIVFGLTDVENSKTNWIIGYKRGLRKGKMFEK